MLKSIIEILESRKVHTEHHSEKVSLLAGRMAVALNFTLQEQKRIKDAAYLHDIGKMAIPEEIVMKEDITSESERYIVQQHVTVGARLLESVKPLRSLASAVLHHHERWDGSGYPNGLKNKNIPFYARIIGLVDRYQNELRKKPDALPLEVVEFIKNTGHYDPELCDVLKQIIAYD